MVADALDKLDPGVRLGIFTLEAQSEWEHILRMDGVRALEPLDGVFDVGAQIDLSSCSLDLLLSLSLTFTIDVVDVGTGLAVLVRSSDFSLVYDAGSNDDIAPRTNRMLAYINDVAPAFTTLDYVILSHRENAGPLQWLPSPVTEKGRWGPRCEDAERVRAGASGILC